MLTIRRINSIELAHKTIAARNLKHGFLVAVESMMFHHSSYEKDDGFIKIG